MKLSNRLYAIASFVQADSKVADIGTDHGYIPVWLVLNGITDNIIATDINKGPLDRARKTAMDNGVENIIDFRLTDGLAGIGSNDADTVIIAGMGGEKIAEIIRLSKWEWKKHHKLILQPMTKHEKLSRFLYENGFSIIDETLTKDSHEIYKIMAVQPERSQLPDIQYHSVSEILLEKNDPLLTEYLEMLINKTSRAINGIEMGKNKDAENLYMLRQRLSGLMSMKGRL